MINYFKQIKTILKKNTPEKEEIEEMSKDTQIRLLSAIVLLLFFLLLASKFSAQLKADLFEGVTLYETEAIEVSDENTTNEDIIKVNINSNNVFELMQIPGIGKSKAEAILQYRKENGDFDYIEEIMEVKGIGEKLFEGMKDYIYISQE